MFQSALVAMKPSPGNSEVIDLALGLGERYGWKLSVCSVIDTDRLAPSEAIPLGGGAFKRERDEAVLAGAREAAAAAMQHCQSECGRRGLTCSTTVCEGDTVEELSRRAQEHDALILLHSKGPDADESLLRSILKHSPRPAIVFPKHAVQNETVVVAYDGSAQAARTLASFAYSGLAAGRAVHVVACDDDHARAEQTSRAACRFLEHHGIVATAHAESREGSASQALLDQAAKHSAGLLVMGAFGKSAAREFFFGSVTRGVLHDSPIPVFLDH